MDVNKEIANTSDLIKMSNELLEKLGIIAEFQNKEDVIFEKDIVKFGNYSGHIIVPRKFIGHRVSLIIKKMEDSKD